jgi:hypothetical protein
MTPGEYQRTLSGLVMSFRAQPTNVLWVHACHLKYHSEFTEAMIDEAKRIVLDEREKITNQGEAEEAKRP